MWCVVQERERRKQHATQRAIEAEELQRAKSIVRRQSMVICCQGGEMGEGS